VAEKKSESLHFLTFLAHGMGLFNAGIGQSHSTVGVYRRGQQQFKQRGV
jgi:hypothetical protein